MTQFFYHHVIGIEESKMQAIRQKTYAKYGDIMHSPHHQSANRRHMSNYDRAAQFAPFDALTGFKDSVIETARITNQRTEQTEDQKQKINDTLQEILQSYPQRIPVKMIRFREDERKDGGCYEALETVVHQVDVVNQKIILKDKTTIPFRDIYHIEVKEHE